MRYTIILLSCLLFIQCKKEVKETVANQKVETKLLKLNNDCLDKRTVNAVFQTCGGACTITYNSKKYTVTQVKKI